MKNEQKFNWIMLFLTILIIILITFIGVFVSKRSDFNSYINLNNDITENMKNFKYRVKVETEMDTSELAEIEYKDGLFKYENFRTNELIYGDTFSSEYIALDHENKVYGAYPETEAKKLVSKHLPDKIEDKFEFKDIFNAKIKEENIDGKDYAVYETEDGNKKYIFDIETKTIVKYIEKQKLIELEEELEEDIPEIPEYVITNIYEFEIGEVKEEDVKILDNYKTEYTLKTYNYLQPEIDATTREIEKMEEESKKIEEEAKKMEEETKRIEEELNVENLDLETEDN